MHPFLRGDREQTSIRRLSFEASVQTLMHWEPMIVLAADNPTEQHRLVAHLKDVITEKLVPDQPNRGEPRAIKRRPKNYQLLTVPGHEMTEQSHQGKYGAE